MREEYSQVIVDYLLTGKEPPIEDGPGAWEIFDLTGNAETVRSAWDALREDLLPDFIRRNPGRRPWSWWQFSAPRWARKFGAYWDGTLPEPRLRVGGKGTPNFEALNYVPAFDRGIPASWVKEWDVAYYNGRAVDVHGNRIGTEYQEGHFPHDAIDPADPPTFESEASYLDRHGLLSAAERKRLTAADFEPEAIR
jgi:hypothetical protein